MIMSTDNFDITIDISKSGSGQAFVSNEVIQVSAKEKFFQILNKLVPDKINNKIINDEENYNIRVHNTILIDGKRGYGKTSFIYSILEEIKDKNKCAKAGNICTLRVIDPTITESKEHFLITIISMIDRKLFDCAGKMSDEDTMVYKNKQTAIANGLTALDSVGKSLSETWSDPKIILSEGIKKNRGALTLIDSFHEYIEFALNKLGKTAFLLVFDDIDTSIDKGRLILELLRKYLTSPHLIVVILGDMSIFNLVSQEIQWKKISPRLTKTYNESAISTLYYDEINKLSDQYLMKILNPKNRIRLKLLQEINDSKSIGIFTEEDGVQKLVSLKEHIDKFCQNVFGEKNNDSIIRIYTNFILSQPLRTLVSLLVDYDNDANKLPPEVLAYNFISGVSSLLDPNKLESILNMYILYNSGLDFALAHYLFKIVVKEDFSNIGNLFDISNVDENLKAIFIIIAAYDYYCVKKVQKFSLLFNFSLFYCYLIDLSTDDKMKSNTLIQKGSLSSQTIIASIGAKNFQFNKGDVLGIFQTNNDKLTKVIDKEDLSLAEQLINICVVEARKKLGDNTRYLSIWELLSRICKFLEQSEEQKFFDGKAGDIDDINNSMDIWRKKIYDFDESHALNLRLISACALRLAMSAAKIKVTGNFFTFIEQNIISIINELIIMGLDGNESVYTYSQFSWGGSNISRNLKLIDTEKPNEPKNIVNERIAFISLFINCPLFYIFYDNKNLPSLINQAQYNTLFKGYTDKQSLVEQLKGCDLSDNDRPKINAMSSFEERFSEISQDKVELSAYYNCKNEFEQFSTLDNYKNFQKILDSLVNKANAKIIHKSNVKADFKRIYEPKIDELEIKNSKIGNHKTDESTNANQE